MSSAARLGTFRGNRRSVNAHVGGQLELLASFACFVDAASDGVRSGLLRQSVAVDLIARSIAALSHGLAMEALDEHLPSDDTSPILELAVDGLLSSRA